MTTAPTSATPATSPTVGSVCSGAGGLDLGLRRAGLRTIWFCEIDPWRRRVLERHWPSVPVHHDLTALDPAELPRPTLLAGGTPCQNLSVAGGRAGLDGEQSRLFWDFIRIRNALEPEWALWENVAGSLSSNDGLDFAQVLAAFVGADVPVPAGGWPSAGVAAGPWGGAVWRVLDAQYFGVPQRRRRVFVAGRLGGPCEPAILLDRAGGAGNPPARRGERPRVAAVLTRGSAGPGVSDPGRRREDDVNLVVSALDRQAGGPDDNSAQAGHLIVGTLPSRGRTGGFDIDPSMAADGYLVVAGDGVPPHTGSDQRGRRPGPRTQDGRERDRDPSDGAATHADGRRYAACGDGVVANVTEWIGRRLLAVIDGTDPDHVPVPQPVARGGPDAEGRVRRRDAGLGIQDDLAYTLGTGAPPAIIPYLGE
jgi:site-specific DNA-cytosine methylase